MRANSVFSGFGAFSWMASSGRGSCFVVLTHIAQPARARRNPRSLSTLTPGQFLRTKLNPTECRVLASARGFFSLVVSSSAMRLLNAARRMRPSGAYPMASRMVVVLPVPARARTTRFCGPVLNHSKMSCCCGLHVRWLICRASWVAWTGGRECCITLSIAELYQTSKTKIGPKNHDGFQGVGSVYIRREAARFTAL